MNEGRFAVIASASEKPTAGGLPLRVLFISHDGGMAGAQQTLLTLLEGIDRDVFKPYLVVPYEGELSEHVSRLGISVTTRQLLHWVPCIAGVRHQNRWRHFWQSFISARARAWSIAALIERYNIDLVYTNTVTCIEGALAAHMTGKPHIWHIHEFIDDNRELLPLLPSWLYSKIIGALSDQIIVPSHALVRGYQTLSGKTAIVPNGLPMPHIPNRVEAKLHLATKLGLDPTRGLVAVIGSIQPRKDHQTFLKAAKKVLARNDDIDFLIVGSGNTLYTQQVRDLVQDLGLIDRVKLTGRWPGKDIMSAINVLVISSEQESFGLTAIESLALGTPVVSTRCGGPEEIIEDGVNGFLVKIKDVDALADAILKLLDDPNLAERFGVAGRSHVLERFTQEQYIKGIQDIMLDVCGRSSHVTNSDSTAGKLI